MFQVDAFSNQIFKGNPAAVLILDNWLPDPTMQAIAEENNLSETAFACPNKNSWDLRWFTPTHEVEFCGHATLATAHILVTEYNTNGQMVFKTRVGQLRVTPKNESYQLDIPSFPPEQLGQFPAEIADIFGGIPAKPFRNFENIFAEFPDEKSVREFIPDLHKIALLGHNGLVITAAGENCDFVSRYFAPGAGIPEDPVTGSTHATLVPFWATKFEKAHLLAYQVSKRGGILECELSGDRVLITGNASTYMKATLHLPD